MYDKSDLFDPNQHCLAGFIDGFKVEFFRGVSGPAVYDGAPLWFMPSFLVFFT